jgi:hypothetical protein
MRQHWSINGLSYLCRDSGRVVSITGTGDVVAVIDFRVLVKSTYAEICKAIFGSHTTNASLEFSIGAIKLSLESKQSLATSIKFILRSFDLSH